MEEVFAAEAQVEDSSNSSALKSALIWAGWDSRGGVCICHRWSEVCRGDRGGRRNVFFESVSVVDVRVEIVVLRLEGRFDSFVLLEQLPRLRAFACLS
jgi:hypothetical protein